MNSYENLSYWNNGAGLEAGRLMEASSNMSSALSLSATQPTSSWEIVRYAREHDIYTNIRGSVAG